MATDNMVVRPALFSDYEGVMNINRNIYDGLDYLPTYYHIFQHSPDCHPFLCEVNGEIVAYTAYRIVDRGTAFVAVAGRTKASAQGKGIFTHFRNESIKLLRCRVPSLEYKVHCGIGANHFDALEKAIKIGDARERIVLKWNILVYKGSKKRLYQGLKNKMNSNNNLGFLHPNEASTIFSDITNMASLFPSGFIISYQNWRPLRVNYTTMMGIVRSHNIICTFREGSKTKLQGASFGHSYLVNLGVRLDIYYYDLAPDPKILQEHVFKHLCHLYNAIPSGEKYNVLVHFPLHLNVEDAKGCLRSVLGDRKLTKTFHREYGVACEALLGPTNSKL